MDTTSYAKGAVLVAKATQIAVNPKPSASVNQDVTLTPGASYVLTFLSFFDTSDGGYARVKIDQLVVYSLLTDTTKRFGWVLNRIDFVATKATANIRLEFFFDPVNWSMAIDDVKIVPLEL